MIPMSADEKLGVSCRASNKNYSASKSHMYKRSPFDNQEYVFKTVKSEQLSDPNQGEPLLASLA